MLSSLKTSMTVSIAAEVGIHNLGRRHFGAQTTGPSQPPSKGIHTSCPNTPPHISSLSSYFEIIDIPGAYSSGVLYTFGGAFFMSFMPS